MNRFRAKPALIATACVSAILLCVATATALTVKPMEFDTGVGMFVEGLIFDPTDDLFRNISGDFELADHQVSRDNENPILGWNSDTWRYQRRDRDDLITGQFAISQTYADFHELCICYQGLDWRLLDRYRREITPETKSESLPGSTPTEVPVAYALLTNSQGLHGYLWYASISASGEMILPPERPGRLGSRLTDAFEGNRSEAHEPIMMVQLWVASSEQLDASTTAQITRDFAQMRQQIAAQVNPEAIK